jgi:hypothetical protein
MASRVHIPDGTSGALLKTRCTDTDMKRWMPIGLICLLLWVPGLLSAQNAKRLPNGYMLDPTATNLVSDLAKFFGGNNRLVRQNGSCISIPIRYAELDGEDRFYQWVVKTADRRGNHNGTAEYDEIKALFDETCRNRGE